MAAQTAIPKPLEPFATGALTGVCTSFALHPFEIIKARAQINRSSSSDVGKFSTLLKQILKTRGLQGLYSGIAAQVQCSALFYLSFFGSYNIICKTLGNIDVLPESAVFFVSGGLAGQVAWAVSLPLDTVKTRIQVELINPPRIRDVVADIWKHNGVKGFYRGVEATLIRAFPANAALFLSYEWTKKLFGNIIVAPNNGCSNSDGDS